MSCNWTILEHCKSLVRAIEALEVVEPTGPIEAGQVWFLLQAYHLRMEGDSWGWFASCQVV